MALAPGTKLGPYEVVAPLGAGGMGEVWRARDTRLGREVAIKVLPDAVSNDPRALARFESEAKAVAALSHPNILSLFDVGDSGGVHYAVTELLEGETLRSLVSRGPVPVRRALDIAEQIAQGLAAAHGKGIVHRDIKPENVFLTRDGHAKLLDFGLARHEPLVRSAEDTHSPTLSAHTEAGAVVGTVGYMSPEQVRGQVVDHRSDVFSFGCVLFEMFTGDRAFARRTAADTMSAILGEEPPKLAGAAPGISPILDALVRRCLEKDPAERFQSVRDLGFAFQSILAEMTDSGAARAAHVAGKPAAGPRREPARLRQVLLPGVCMLVLGAGIAAIAVRFLKPPPPARAVAHLSVNLSPGVQLATDNPPLALSPDGSFLAYVATRSGVRQLFVRPLNSQEARLLPGTEGAEAPFASPDGQWIGFFAGGKLKKTSVAGGTVLPLCDSSDVGGATWGRDDAIVFAPSSNSGLSRVPAVGGKPEILTSLDRTRGEYSHRWPQFLPGGRALLFSVQKGPGWDEYDIEALRLDTGERRIVLRGGIAGRHVPTGHLIYYRAGTLLAVRFDPARLTVSGKAPETVAEGVMESSATTGAEYSFSDEGSLAYVPARRQFDLRLVWVDRRGTIEPLAAPLRAYRAVSLSPDGRRAAAHVWSGTYEIWTYDMERGALSRLTTQGGSSLFPVWAPDGKRLAYQGFRQGLRNIYQKAADGTGDEERLTTGEDAQFPTSWSPDGKWLAYFDVGPTTRGADITALRLEGKRRQEPLLRTPAHEAGARFSPDGRWLAYSSNESGRTEVYVQPFPGPGGKWQVSTEGGRWPTWARNGRELFYYDGGRMMAVDVRTEPAFEAGKPRLLFEGRFRPYYDVAPDGQRFLMIQAVEPEQPATQIDLVLNWFEELGRLVPTAK